MSRGWDRNGLTPTPRSRRSQWTCSGVDDLEAEAELLAHLPLPLATQARRADHEDLLGLIAQHKFLGNETRLDGLAETDVVGDQQAHPGHPQRFDQWEELVVLDVYAGPERGLECPRVGRRNRAPASRVEERREGVRLINPVTGVRQLGLGTNLCAGLGLPEDPEGRRASLVVDRHQADKVVASPSVRTHRVQRARRLPHRLDNPIPIPHPNQVPLAQAQEPPPATRRPSPDPPGDAVLPAARPSTAGAQPQSCVLQDSYRIDHRSPLTRTAHRCPVPTGCHLSR